MKIYERDRFVVAEDRPVMLPAMAAGSAVLLALHALGYAGEPAGGLDIGAWAGSAMMAACALATWRREITEFDRFRKQVVHSVWTPLRQRRRVLRFRDIETVSVETAPGAKGASRVVLHTREGPLPLSNAYTAANEDWHYLADIIRATVGLPTMASRARQSILNILAQYPAVVAMRRLREERGLSLSEARREIGELGMGKLAA